MKKFLKKPGVQSLLASLICIFLGLFIGFIVLLFIKPEGAFNAILTVIKNFFNYNRPALQYKNFGNTLVKTAPLLMCALSILFAYKVGLFNIGTAGQYVVGICASLYPALAWGWGWLPCVLMAIAAGALWGMLVGLLKAFCNVNEVISGIMLNWIGLYLTNMILTLVKESTSPYTFHITDTNPSALLPDLGLQKVFNGNVYVTIAIPVSILLALAVSVIMNRTKFGYELKATGNNKNAAKYAGMKENRNIILTLVISGALAGLGGSMLYLTDFEQWSCTSSAVPAMGFNGIAVTFLGGLNPIGTIFASYFIQHITSGGAYIDKTAYCSQISDLISSLIIYLCGFVMFIKYAMNSIISRREKKEAEKLAEKAPEPADAETEKGGDA